MYSLFFSRLLSRLVLWFHKYWWVSYSGLSFVVLAVFVLLLRRWVHATIPIMPSSFSELTMAIGGVAVLVVAIRQHKDARAQIEARQLPEVARYTGSGTFLWDKSIFWPDRDIDLSYLFRIKIFPGSFITNIRGYLLYQGWYYPFLFVHPSAFDKAKKEQEDRRAQGETSPTVGITIPLTQTYARGGESGGGYELVPVPFQAARKKCSYPGPYYCISFSLPSGRSYFLEENEQFQMKLSPLEDQLPSWRRDYLSWM